MHYVEPEVFLIAEPRVHTANLYEYLSKIGAANWDTDSPSDAEKLSEIYGRLCYRSWAPGLNANVLKVREGNKTYLENIIKSRHGRVLQHAQLSFIFSDVSRVFTHEMITHQPGCTTSQESLRYVRLTDLGQWLPECVIKDGGPDVVAEYRTAFEHMELLQVRLAEQFKLDDPELPFSKKKEYTSAMRRLAPMGLATTYGWSANLRAIRWCLEVRTHESAEEEIRLVFTKMGKIVLQRYPNAFQDFKVTKTGPGEICKFEAGSSKI